MNIGDSYEVTRTVTPELTAEAAGSGGLTVFGTPFMAAMMENAAFTYLQQQLPAGRSSVLPLPAHWPPGVISFFWMNSPAVWTTPT